MHDLNTINRLNVEGFLEGAEKLRKEGRHVVVSFDGVHVTGFESFEHEADAFTKMSELQAQAGASERYTLLLPSGVNVEASRPVQLLDGEEQPDTPEQPELTTEEEGQLIVACSKRDNAQTALQAAALAFATAQGECNTLAEDLRARMLGRAKQFNLI